MATREHPMLNGSLLPDNSGDVVPEPAAVNWQANDRYPHMVWRFADTATRLVLGGRFRVPQDYVSNPRVVYRWSTVAPTGNARLEVDVTAIAPTESGDPSADQETGGVTDAAGGTARNEEEAEISLTTATFAKGDEVQFAIVRDGTDAADTLSDNVFLLDAVFKYDDA